jgi:predicted MFS family arabinose efflux permease
LTAVTTNLMVCAFGQMLFCAMPVLISNLGYHSTYAGVMVYAFSFASVLFRPFTGWLATLLPSRKTVGTCLAIFSLTCIVLYWSPPLWIVVVVRAIQGVIMCVYGTIFGALVADIIPAQRFSEGMGYYSMGIPAMSFFGPAMGLVILQVLGKGKMFLFLCLWMLAATGLCLSLRSGNKPISLPLTAGRRNIIQNSFVKNAAFHSTLLALVLASHSSLVSFFSLYAQAEQKGGLASFYLVGGCSIICCRLFLTAGRSWLHTKALLLPAMLVMGMCILILSGLPEHSTLILLATIYGTSMGIVQPGLIVLAMDSCSKNQRAAATATYYLGIDVGIGIGGLLWGIAASSVGYRMVFILAAGVNITAFIALFLRRKLKKSTPVSNFL